MAKFRGRVFRSAALGAAWSIACLGIADGIRMAGPQSKLMLEPGAPGPTRAEAAAGQASLSYTGYSCLRFGAGPFFIALSLFQYLQGPKNLLAAEHPSGKELCHYMTDMADGWELEQCVVPGLMSHNGDIRGRAETTTHVDWSMSNGTAWVSGSTYIEMYQSDGGVVSGMKRNSAVSAAFQCRQPPGNTRCYRLRELFSNGFAFLGRANLTGESDKLSVEVWHGINSIPRAYLDGTKWVQWWRNQLPAEETKPLMRATIVGSLPAGKWQFLAAILHLCFTRNTGYKSPSFRTCLPPVLGKTLQIFLQFVRRALLPLAVSLLNWVGFMVVTETAENWVDSYWHKRTSIYLLAFECVYICEKIDDVLCQRDKGFAEYQPPHFSFRSNFQLRWELVRRIFGISFLLSFVVGYLLPTFFDMCFVSHFEVFGCHGISSSPWQCRPQASFTEEVQISSWVVCMHFFSHLLAAKMPPAAESAAVIARNEREKERARRERDALESDVYMRI